MALNLFSIPPSTSFLDAIAAGWLARDGDTLVNAPMANAHGLILLPTRRSARSLAEAFLRASDGHPLLLPRIAALGGMDEVPLALTGAVDLPPAVEPMQRLAALTRLILAARGSSGAPRTADRAWLLAGDLAALMDEAERAEIDLRRTLPDAVDAAHAAHWAEILKFLEIVTHAWPAWLADNGLMNPAARMVALLDAQARAWQDQPPDHPVLIAGTTAGIRAVARLLRVVANLPNGQVVLPALDMEMDEDTWAVLEPSHPQAGLADLLAGLGATRGDVRPWPLGLRGLESSAVEQFLPLPLREGGGGRGQPARTAPQTPPPTPLPQGEGEKMRQPEPHSDIAEYRRPTETAPPRTRFSTLSAALLPAVALDAWRDPTPVALDGLSRLIPADQQEEAESIALILRDTLETPNARAALVTPDRDLAGRVAACLLRYGVVADDSAGESLTETPPAVFMRLLVHAIADDLAPVPLLALLKHPLAAAGLSPVACRSAARELEIICLRGPRPPRGIVGLRRAIDKAGHDVRLKAAQGGEARFNTILQRLRGFLARLESCLEPALRIDASVEVSPQQALAAVFEAAERLAATADQPGPARLWADEEGEALAERLSAVLAAIVLLPDQRRAVLPGLLDAVLQGATVRGRRALRGRGGTEHPRIHIWGLLEARLQSVDRIVLGGLAEGVWPPQPEPGPWLSRPMRTAVGLPSLEEAIGQSAHDFVSLACAAPDVVLSCPVRRDGAPAVPARWLFRLQIFLEGKSQALAEHPASAWVRALDQPMGGAVPVSAPRPNPPVGRRPRRMSVTEIETWLRDPYAIYARHILKLDALKPLDEATDAADYGMLVHQGMNLFLEEHGTRWPPNAAMLLRRAMDRALTEAGLREALAAWWAPRLGRIADWVADIEMRRRSENPPTAIAAEKSGMVDLARPGGRFRLTGRADRIERRRDGSIAILDYKTGSPPTQKDVDSGLAPQLLLEAAMVADGAFGPDVTGQATELQYWHLTGGFQPGEIRRLYRGNADAAIEATQSARNGLSGLIDAFDAGQVYRSQPHPDRAPRFSDYAQLARVAEWSAAGDDTPVDSGSSGES